MIQLYIYSIYLDYLYTARFPLKSYININCLLIYFISSKVNIEKSSQPVSLYKYCLVRGTSLYRVARLYLEVLKILGDIFPIISRGKDYLDEFKPLLALPFYFIEVLPYC